MSFEKKLAVWYSQKLITIIVFKLSTYSDRTFIKIWYSQNIITIGDGETFVESYVGTGTNFTNPTSPLSTQTHTGSK